MANYDKNFITSMTGFMDLGDNEDPKPKVANPGDPIPLYIPKDTIMHIKINDTRTVSPTTGRPLKDTEKKSLKVDPELIKDIVKNASINGIDPLTALAISYQETGLNKNAPFNLNPKIFGKPTGNAEEGMKSLQEQFKYAQDLQKRGVIPNTEDYLLQGNNGYGIIKRGHADLEGANRIYGLEIPKEGINLKQKPLYGQTVLSLRELLKNNPQIMDIIKSTTLENKK
jgi:hypothetical protein